MGVCQGCCSEVPRSAWLRTADVCGLTALEAGSPKSMSWQGRAPSETCGAGSALASLARWQPWAFLGLWTRHSDPSSHSILPRPLSDTSLSVSKFSLFLRIRTHPKHLILTWPHLQKLNFQRPHSEVLGLGLQHICGGRGLFNPRHHTARSPPAGFLLGEAITWIKPLS